ncbi:MAG: aspartate-semialdehyde dehydrogenase [Polyangiaceae bacterium]|nr:aspartate-semialdehyde dehydrogenase [Polyangiaceae bacterium]
MLDKKYRVGVLGATGMVGQRLVSLLHEHAWFDVTVVAASGRSAGRAYADVVKGRWFMGSSIPEKVGSMVVRDAMDVGGVSSDVDFVFCAVDMRKEAVAELELAYVRSEVPVVSNNSAHRFTGDVPMVIPEVNPEHLGLIEYQRRRLGVRRGFIVVKPNCSLQSYVPAIHPLMCFGPTRMAVCTYQAVSGAGKTLDQWPEMVDNVIPYIAGEEEKSEREPMRIWGCIEGGEIVPCAEPLISAQCVRVPVSDGHLAAVFVSFANKPGREEILKRWSEYEGRPQMLGLPSAPTPFLTYFDDAGRPQPLLDREVGGGMGVSLGRLRGDSLFDYRFIALSNNTIRGAAGGGILTAELLVHDGFIVRG